MVEGIVEYVDALGAKFMGWDGMGSLNKSGRVLCMSRSLFAPLY